MKNFRFQLRASREPRKPAPLDALTELVVGAIAAGYPGGILQSAIIHDSGLITGHFVDENLNKTFEFEIKDGFSFKPSK
jgi:outer membrane lipoprotein SlyB